jgi:hypothetical protein
VTATPRSEWFYRRHGKKHGPLNIDALSDLLARGEVDWTDLVWSEGFSDWMPAHRAPSLCFLQDLDDVLRQHAPSRNEGATGGVVRVQCHCGAMLKVPDQVRHRRLRCPKCGSVVSLEKAATIHSSRNHPDTTPRSRRSIRLSDAVQLSALAIFVVGCFGVIWLLFDWESKERQRVHGEQATTTVAVAHEGLDEAHDRSKAIETSAAAEDLLERGKSNLDDGEVEHALHNLEAYAKSPTAERRDEARALVSQITAATDEELIYEMLSRKNDGELQRITDARWGGLGNVTHPALLTRQGEVAGHIATRILDERTQQRREDERRLRAAEHDKATAAMTATLETRKKRLAGHCVPAVPLGDRQRVAAAASDFMQWMFTQKLHQVADVQHAIDSFNRHLHGLAESGDRDSLARGLAKIPPEHIAIIDDAIAESSWGKISASSTKTHGGLWLDAWESACGAGVVIEEKPPAAATLREPLVFLNDKRCPRTREELITINKQTRARVDQQFREAGMRSADRRFLLEQGANFLLAFGDIFRGGRKDLIAAALQHVTPTMEQGIQVLFDQTEFGNFLLLVAESDEEVRYLTYSEMWARAHAFQVR